MLSISDDEYNKWKKRIEKDYIHDKKYNPEDLIDAPFQDLHNNLFYCVIQYMLSIKNDNINSAPKSILKSVIECNGRYLIDKGLINLIDEHNLFNIWMKKNSAK